MSEVPLEGTTEVWEIINLTADTHPMHTHLVQCQILNRQAFNVKGYTAAYNAAFPGSATIIDPATGLPYAAGVYIPGFGPPLDYNTGNPRGPGRQPGYHPVPERCAGPAGGQRGRLEGHHAVPAGNGHAVCGPLCAAGHAVAPAVRDLNFPFDPFALKYNYVWHCHIVDHEDNEMMRPYIVTPPPAQSGRTSRGGLLELD